MYLYKNHFFAYLIDTMQKALVICAICLLKQKNEERAELL